MEAQRTLPAAMNLPPTQTTTPISRQNSPPSSLLGLSDVPASMEPSQQPHVRSLLGSGDGELSELLSVLGELLELAGEVLELALLG